METINTYKVAYTTYINVLAYNAEQAESVALDCRIADWEYSETTVERTDEEPHEYVTSEPGRDMEILEQWAEQQKSSGVTMNTYFVETTEYIKVNANTEEEAEAKALATPRAQWEQSEFIVDLYEDVFGYEAPAGSQ